MINLKTGIVIIHYNDLESLKHLVENVENYHVISKIVIVDNNSRKDVKKSLRLITGKKIKLIENKKNFGFAPNNNMILNNKKIKSIGWRPKYDLKQGYDRLLKYLEEEENN